MQGRVSVALAASSTPHVGAPAELPLKSTSTPSQSASVSQGWHVGVAAVFGSHDGNVVSSHECSALARSWVPQRLVEMVGGSSSAHLGDSLGELLGDVVGDVVGDALGDVVGDVLGDALGFGVGLPEGAGVDVVGDRVGDVVGDVEGDVLGDALGFGVVGDVEGDAVGGSMGGADGGIDGGGTGGVNFLKGVAVVPEAAA
jgi:hypothetical protein